jgi:hypothetical protein
MQRKTLLFLDIMHKIPVLPEFKIISQDEPHLGFWMIGFETG